MAKNVKKTNVPHLCVSISSSELTFDGIENEEVFINEDEDSESESSSKKRKREEGRETTPSVFLFRRNLVPMLLWPRPEIWMTFHGHKKEFKPMHR